MKKEKIWKCEMGFFLLEFWDHETNKFADPMPIFERQTKINNNYKFFK